MPTPVLVAALMTAALVMPGTAGAVRGHQPDDAATTTRRINVAMQDNTFSPDSFDVRVGDTVVFVFSNFGGTVHDAFIGDKGAQQHHEKEMRTSSGGHDHAHEGGVIVHPGETRELRYVFERPGALEIACHQPGHYESGMIAALDVHP